MFITVPNKEFLGYTIADMIEHAENKEIDYGRLKIAETKDSFCGSVIRQNSIGYFLAQKTTLIPAPHKMYVFILMQTPERAL